MFGTKRGFLCCFTFTFVGRVGDIVNKIVVVYSGGLDSTVLLTKCKQEYDEVLALNFTYGSKHNAKERKAARVICKKIVVSLYFYNLPTECRESHLLRQEEFLKSDLLKSGGEIPEGHYEEESMKQTVVPCRNGIMLLLAAGFAESRGIGNVAIANHAGDHVVYKDCTPEFIHSCDTTIQIATGYKVVLNAPFTLMRKHDIVRLGAELRAPMELTWSCYKGEEKHCGLCGTCQERIEAFKLAGIEDHTIYEGE